MNYSKYAPYHKESADFACTLTENVESQVEKYKIITNWIRKNTSYDYIRAIKIPKKNGLPDIDHVWKTRLGICWDIAALAHNMLKAVKLNPYLCIGWADKRWHAWVECKIDNITYRFDHPRRAKTYNAEKKY